METTEKLNLLSTYKQEIEKIELAKQTLKDELIPRDIKDQLNEIDAEFEGDISSMNSKIANLEAEIKQDVLNTHKTVKGMHLMAVWNKGRISWDNKGLDGFMVAHPEMSAFRKEGDPSVTIRKISNGE